MKHLMTAALALTLMAGGAASAQDRHDDRGDHGGNRGGASAGGGASSGGVAHNRGGQPLIQQQAPQPQRQAQPQAQPRLQGQQGGGQPGRGAFTGGQRGVAPSQNVNGAQAGRSSAPSFNRGPSSYRPRPGGFLDSRRWSPGQRFRVSAYRYPRGYGYQYWGFGAFLPGVFLSQDYAIYDYWTYGLPAPPPGYHWIRVGPDALLVRFGDGYVLDAAYGLFY